MGRQPAEAPDGRALGEPRREAAGDHQGAAQAAQRRPTRRPVKGSVSCPERELPRARPSEGKADGRRRAGSARGRSRGGTWRRGSPRLRTAWHFGQAACHARGAGSVADAYRSSAGRHLEVAGISRSTVRARHDAAASRVHPAAMPPALSLAARVWGTGCSSIGLHGVDAHRCRWASRGGSLAAGRRAWCVRSCRGPSGWSR